MRLIFTKTTRKFLFLVVGGAAPLGSNVCMTTRNFFLFLATVVGRCVGCLEALDVSAYHTQEKEYLQNDQKHEAQAEDVKPRTFGTLRLVFS